MASAQPTTPDTMVTLKVNFEGLTRRYKLPLRDMGASTLEDRVRGFLGVAPGTDLLLERYSDSAGAYVVLDPSNTSVYKQLYRAAKAKQKLKLRVTNNEQEQEQEPEQEPEREPEPEPVHEKQAPKPVTVEDVPEAQLATPSKPVVMSSAVLADKAINDLIDMRNQSTSTLTDTIKKELPVADPGADFESALLASLMNRQARFDEEERTKQAADVRVVHGVCGRDLWFKDAAKSESAPPRQPWSRCPALAPPNASFAVCCNSCDKHIPDSHYHCSTCDDGDFDLCQACVDQGITCYGEDHWLIKRVVKNGQIITSTTETIAPKPKAKPEPVEEFRPAHRADFVPVPTYCIRTCNCCVQELPERSFLHCTSCDDYDLCHNCFEKDSHGHNPKHAFIPAVDGAQVPSHIEVKLAPGRNQTHNAICDGCDKYINGVRHKCLDCPDWDYCGDCVLNAKFVHPNHRFVPVYEPLSEMRGRVVSRSIHFGICCDGPLCSRARNSPTYIAGVRYKCTVCHDTDFCANCEASPANTHNRTHPLVKFKTPVRHVTVTTTGERGDGQRLPQMGDRSLRRTSSRATETVASPALSGAMLTVVDVKPTEPVKVEVADPEPAQVVPPKVIKEEEPEPVKPEPIPEKVPATEDLVAVYVTDTVADGTIMPPNHVFEQTWVLRNDGPIAWPAGCSVKFVGGDYMGIADSSHPAGISELVSASESTKCYTPLVPGQEFAFTVLLRTPAREGKIISYWRLTGPDGIKFGHRLWCDVSVRVPPPPPPVVEEPQQEVVKEEPKEDESIPETQRSSQMIFPKLEAESPQSSIHQETKEVDEEESTPAVAAEADDFEECHYDEWEASDDGFMTDEEYDILDASDEEYLEDQQKRVVKK